MKKLIVALSVGTLLMGTSVMAGEETGPAIVEGDVGCILLNGLGDLESAESSHRVVSMDANGNIILKCSSKNVEPTPKKAAKYDYETTGFSCNTGYGSTTDWKNIVTPSGKSTLTCIIHPKQAED